MIVQCIGKRSITNKSPTKEQTFLSYFRRGQTTWWYSSEFASTKLCTAHGEVMIAIRRHIEQESRKARVGNVLHRRWFYKVFSSAIRVEKEIFRIVEWQHHLWAEKVFGAATKVDENVESRSLENLFHLSYVSFMRSMLKECLKNVEK